jgi:hypothetical protein
MKVVAIVPNLMDRSRFVGPGVEVQFVGVPELPTAAVEADLVVVDLATPDVLAAVEQVAAGPRIIGFGPHVDDDLLAAGHAAGCTEVLPRSRFFARWPDL